MDGRLYMAKELPYFKFNVSEWIMGSISDEPDNIQGIFIQMCCLYWSKSCELHYTNAIKRMHKLKVNALITRGFLKVDDGKIVISFLDEQFKELSDIHNKRVKSGLASVKARVSAKSQHLDKDKEIDKDKYNAKAHLVSLGFEEKLIKEWFEVRKKKKLTNTETAIELFVKEVLQTKKDKNEVLRICVEKSWGGFKSEWLWEKSQPVQLTTPISFSSK